MKKLLQPLVDHFAWNLSNHIMKRRYDQACEEARNKLPQLLPRVAASLEVHRSEGGLSHYFSEFKLLELAEFLWQFRPQTVVELGGGATSAVFAEYAGSFPGVQIVSVDESADYLSATQKRISHNLKDKLTFIHCPRCEAVDDNGELICYYDAAWQKTLSDHFVEFIYVDGTSADDVRHHSWFAPGPLSRQA